MILCIKIREVIWQIRTLLLFKLWGKKPLYSLFSIFMLLCCIVLKKGQKSVNLSVSTLTTCRGTRFKVKEKCLRIYVLKIKSITALKRLF